MQTAKWGYMKKYKIKFYDKEVTHYTIIKYKIHDKNYVPYISNKDKITIRCFVDKKLLEEVKQQKREQIKGINY